MNTHARKILATGLTVAIGLGSLPAAHAGECERKTRENILDTNELEFINQTSATIKVKFYDESASAESEISQASIAPGGSARYKQKASSQATHTAVGVLTSADVYGKTTCSVSVSKYSNPFPDTTIHTRWLSSSCEVDSKTGLPRRMSCEREYHPGDGRWQTTWTIRE